MVRLTRGSWKAVVAVVAATVLAGACGHSKAAGPPKAVPLSLVPATLGSGASQFTVTEFAGARKQFAQAGTRSEVADGRLWEIRNGATLIGTLQISTVKPSVALDQQKVRAKITDLVTEGGATTIKVRGIDVVSSADAQKTTYLWFGKQLFEYLQVKGANIQPEAILRGLLVFQKPSHELDVKVVGKT
jgi:hypothetical protein